MTGVGGKLIVQCISLGLAKGVSTADLVGDLTIRGTSKSVRMPVEVSGPIQDPWGNTRMGISGTLTIDRTDFGLNYNNMLEAGGLVVGKDVTIQIDVELVASAEEAEE